MEVLCRGIDGRFDGSRSKPMTLQNFPARSEIERRVCDIAAEHFGWNPERIHPDLSLIEDLAGDSFDLVNFILDLEEEFQVTLPEEAPNPVYKTIFTRSPFRLADMAELIYVQLRANTIPARASAPEVKQVSLSWRGAPLRKLLPVTTTTTLPFTQLDGRWSKPVLGPVPLFEPLGETGKLRQFRRLADGMRCVEIPAATVELGCDTPDALDDEQPQHESRLDSFLMDAETVSTIAYCRFLNSTDVTDTQVLKDWFVLDEDDDRIEHALVHPQSKGWQPLPGTERWPMILVSWYGANAYSLWANGRDWRDYRDDTLADEGSFLPSEAQWEYAARGARWQPFPWGEASPTHERLRYGLHRRGATYRPETLPMAAVHEPCAVSPFGLHHMAGNVWQWCRDWYDPKFYQSPEAVQPNPVNRRATGIRSERGGSWIGSAELCRSSYRRGRPIAARGRCLGFRCISSAADVSRF